MRSPKTSSEKTSVYNTLSTNTLGIVKQMKTVCTVGQQSGVKHNKVDKGPHSRDSALIFHTSLPWLLDSASQSNLVYHNLFLTSSEETWQKNSMTASGENEQKVDLRINLCPVMDAHTQHSYHYQVLTDLMVLQPKKDT